MEYYKNRNRLKGPTTLTINSYQNSPEVFNKYSLSVTKNNTYDNRCDNKQGYNINKNPKYCLSKLYHKPFPNIKFKNTSTKEIEKMINSLKTKESSGYDEISTKILKISISISIYFTFRRSITRSQTTWIWK